MSDEATRESQLRRMAKRQGLWLKKSRTRDRRAPEHGRFVVLNPQTNAIAASGGRGEWLTLDEVEEFLASLKG